MKGRNMLSVIDPEAEFDVESWPTSEDGKAVRQLVEGRLATVPLLTESIPPRPNSRRRWIAAVISAAAVVAAIALPTLLLRESSTEVGSNGPIRLGQDSVWPAAPMTGSPEDLGKAFARDVLGWTDPTVRATTEDSDPKGPVWILGISPSGASFDALTAPAPGGGRHILQIGTPPSVALADFDAFGALRIDLDVSTSASRADVILELVDGAEPVTVMAGPADFDRGFVETAAIGDPGAVAAVLVLYRDDAGDVVATHGGVTGASRE